MFFYASKILWFFATPSNLLPVLAVLGLGLAMVKGRRRIGLALAWTGLVCLFAFGLSPAASWLMYPLETRFPAFTHDGRPVTGIVVLGGALAPDSTVRLGQPVVNEAGERILAAVELARRYPSAAILLSGGSGRLIDEEFTEADATARYLEAVGVPAERLVVENRSRTTFENATLSRALVNPRPGDRWLLVTSAWHMPRSMAVFRSAGFDVTPYPVDFRTVGDADTSRPFGSISDGLRRLDIAAKEWMGLVAYRLSGRSDEWLPGPR